MRDLLRQKLFEFENTFFSKVIRRALGMMIPFVLAAGIASAIRDLPIPAFQSLLQGSLQWLYLILNIIGGGFCLPAGLAGWKVEYSRIGNGRLLLCNLCDISGVHSLWGSPKE